MPRLEHPKQAGWEWNNGNSQPAPAPPSAQHGQHSQGAVHDHHTTAHVSKPVHGGIPSTGGGGSGARAGGGGGGDEGVRGSVPWLQEHSFHARQGAYVSLKERSLDTSQEVSRMSEGWRKWV